jgi:hypothetical protein
MSIKLFAHNPNSEGAKALSAALGINRLRHEGSRWRPRTDDKVINWGSSRALDYGPAMIINNPVFVQRASNKLQFFQQLDQFEYDQAGENCRVPEWTTDINVARTWLPETKVVCRTLLTSHSGNGIIIASEIDQVVPAPLYTRYVKKQAEYRVHIVRGRIIDVQRKIRDPDNTPVDWHVRSHRNGFIFVRSGFELPVDAETQSLRAFRASGLDFGAVDCIIDRDGNAWVLECNTAPGLVGTTVTKYADAFREAFFT